MEEVWCQIDRAWVFLEKNLGLGSLAELPNQLHHMKMSLAMSLWKDFFVDCLFVFANFWPFFDAYRTKMAMITRIQCLSRHKNSISWWLTHSSCKYMLCCLIHKDCKDMSTRPCEHPAGDTLVAAREAKKKLCSRKRGLLQKPRGLLRRMEMWITGIRKWEW